MKVVMASVLSQVLPKGTETMIRITVSLLMKNIHTSEICSVATAGTLPYTVPSYTI